VRPCSAGSLRFSVCTNKSAPDCLSLSQSHSCHHHPARPKRNRSAPDCLSPSQSHSCHHHSARSKRAPSNTPERHHTKTVAACLSPPMPRPQDRAPPLLPSRSHAHVATSAFTLPLCLYPRPTLHEPTIPAARFRDAPRVAGACLCHRFRVSGLGLHRRVCVIGCKLICFCNLIYFWCARRVIRAAHEHAALGFGFRAEAFGVRVRVRVRVSGFGFRVRVWVCA